MTFHPDARNPESAAGLLRAVGLHHADPGVPRHWPFRRRRIAGGIASTPQDVLTLWFGRTEPRHSSYPLWFGCSEAVDATIRERCLGLWGCAEHDELDDWLAAPDSSLALLVLTDQLGRHMFRGTPRAYALDDLGYRASLRCIDFLAAGHRFRLDEALLIAWPWLHREALHDQHRAVHWIDALLDVAGPGGDRPRLLAHSYAFRCHRDVIRRFGRYPHRNDILGRSWTREERAHRPACWEMDQSADSRGGTLRYGLASWAFELRLARRFMAHREHGALAALCWARCKGWALTVDGRRSTPQLKRRGAGVRVAP